MDTGSSSKSMNRDYKKKKRLFDLYAGNLRACRPEYQDLFACPLCLTLFDRSSLDNELLSLEHIIPSGKGAANETLTCKKCNNTTGSAMDADLLKRIKHEEQMERNGGPVRCEIVTGEGRHNANMFIKAGESPTIEIIGLPAQSNPSLLKKAVEEYVTNINFTMHWRAGYVHARSQTAMLRSAYLTMFRYYGYCYILQSALDRVREQIQQPFVTDEHGQKALRHEALLKGVKTCERSCPETNVMMVMSPEHLQSFAVHLGLSKELQTSYLVIMPGPEDDADQVYEHLEPNEHYDFTKMRYAPEIIANPTLAYSVLPLWHWRNELPANGEEPS